MKIRGLPYDIKIAPPSPPPEQYIFIFIIDKKSRKPETKKRKDAILFNFQ